MQCLNRLTLIFMQYTFTISGLHCESCLKLVPMLLKEIQGVKEVQISGLDGNVVLEADKTIRKEDVAQALEGTDYQVI